MTALFTFLLAALPALAHTDHRVPHQFLLYGQAETFASHLIAPSPHHHQLIFRLKLPAATRDLIARERAAHPSALILYRLDAVDLTDLAAIPQLQGRLLRVEPSGARHPLVETLTVPKADFEVIHHAQLPLSLEAVPAKH